MEEIIEANNLSKSFKSGNFTQEVLKNLDIKILKGEFTVIMGSSGSGKSTLLYSLSGMDRPSSGQIIYSKKEDIAKLKEDKLADFRSKNCGFVFQQIYLVDSMSVLDNVLVSGLINNKDKKAVLKKAKELLNSVGINEMHYKKFPSEISGGEAQRVALVRAAISNPKILFADEPTGALNSLNAKMVLDILSNLYNNGQTVVMVTHDILSAIRADRILYLRDGKIEGELKLERYQEEDENRKALVRNFLSNLGW